MKTWQIALIGVGVVGVGALAVYALTSPSQPAQPQFTPQGLTGAPVATDASTAAVTGGFGLARDILGAISSKVARDDAARAARDERTGDGGGKTANVEDDGTYDSALALAAKQGRR